MPAQQMNAMKVFYMYCHSPLETTTETKVNKSNKLQQAMKLGRYLHVSDPLLFPGVKAAECLCDRSNL